MGCGNSKGKDLMSEDDDTEINIKPVGVYSLDKFFDAAKETLDTFMNLTSPITEFKDRFFEVTGFFAVPGAGKSYYHNSIRNRK